MRELLLEKLNPLINSFIEGLIKIEDVSIQKGKEFERQVLKTQAERELLKEKEAENNRILAKNIAELGEEKLKFQNLQKELQNEISKYISMQGELNIKIKENDLLIEGNKNTRNEIEKELKRVQEKTRQYENKITFLQADENRLNEERKENEKQKELNAAKERENLKTEQANMVRSEELDDRELEIAQTEKRIIFVKKQLNINGQSKSR